VTAGHDPDDPALGHVARFYVRPDHWARGVGRHLHDAALGHLRALGYPAATLWVLEDNGRARSWYERRGWDCLGDRKPANALGAVDDVRYGIVL
jgi:GNAT superfamily N-acetyltransferase